MSCGEAEVAGDTEVFLRIDAAGAARDAESVRVQVDALVVELVRDEWPLELVVVPQSGDASRRFVVRAFGLAAGKVLGAAKAEQGFEKGRRASLTLTLDPAYDAGPLPKVNAQAASGGTLKQPVGVDGAQDAAASGGDGGEDDPAGTCGCEAGLRCIEGACVVAHRLALAQYASCAIAKGKASCWGAQTAGYLGASNVMVPKLLADTPEGAFSALQLQAYGVCGFGQTGKAYCLGRNTAGMLGIGMNSATDSAVPAEVRLPDGVARFLDLTAGANHSCAIGDDEKVYCWGTNIQGQLGVSAPAASPVPLAVPGLPASKALMLTASDSHTCALHESGAISCWGGNLVGQLGDGSTAKVSPPVVVQWPSSAAKPRLIDAGGGSTTCAVDEDNQIFCWGLQLIDAAPPRAFDAAPVPGPELESKQALIGLSVSDRAACVLTEAGQAYCWGTNTYGILGDGTKLDSMVPKKVLQPSGVTFVEIATAYERHACGLTRDGRVYCWGSNAERQLGTGTTQDAQVPVQVSLP